MTPVLTPIVSHGVEWHEDAALRRGAGIVVAFSVRRGGVSATPFDTLNLAGHVGDEPERVDENRLRLLTALGLDDMRDRLVTADQVHGEVSQWVEAGDAGRGAFDSHGAPPIPRSDALLTAERGLPLMLLFADCVPVVIVDPMRRRVAVVHAGWRGALAGLPGAAARRLVSEGSSPEDLLAYVGAHICARHYEVDDTLMSHFVNRFGTVAEAEPGHLDLGAVVSADLSSSGVGVKSICRLGVCTAEATDSFFSYRASFGVTGRHAALAVILR